MRNWNLLLQCDVSWNEVPLWNFLVNYCDWTKYILNILNIHHDYRGFLISKKLLNVAPLKHLKMILFPKKLIYPLNIDGWKLEDASFPFKMVPFQVIFCSFPEGVNQHICFAGPFPERLEWGRFHWYHFGWLGFWAYETCGSANWREGWSWRTQTDWYFWCKNSGVHQLTW